MKEKRIRYKLRGDSKILIGGSTMEYEYIFTCYEGLCPCSEKRPHIARVSYQDTADYGSITFYVGEEREFGYELDPIKLAIMLDFLKTLNGEESQKEEVVI